MSTKRSFPMMSNENADTTIAKEANEMTKEVVYEADKKRKKKKQIDSIDDLKRLAKSLKAKSRHLAE